MVPGYEAKLGCVMITVDIGLCCREQYDREQALDDFKTGHTLIPTLCRVVTFLIHMWFFFLIPSCHLCVQVESPSLLLLTWRPGDWTSKTSRKIDERINCVYMCGALLQNYVHVHVHVCSSRHVVNYDFPNHIEDYVHRVGRTGRAG